MPVSRNVIFKSVAFNTTEPKEYFINDTCFGDDLARWMMKELNARGIQTGEEPGQEDFGWYFEFQVGGVEYLFIISHRPGDDDLPPSEPLSSVDWMCVIERNAGLIASLFGACKRGITLEAVQAIHGVLSSPTIYNIRWYLDKDYDSDGGGKPEPWQD
ncbi:MAG: hypothetical protein NTX50_31080 [Candidatus Sumerlaeota bacterium]|nr:hypothetical protein [Candidatus Sumerlaeota bacterium]